MSMWSNCSQSADRSMFFRHVQPRDQKLEQKVIPTAQPQVRHVNFTISQQDGIVTVHGHMSVIHQELIVVLLQKTLLDSVTFN